MVRKRLTDILHGSDRGRLESAWDSTRAAQDFTPLPAGEFDATIERGELINSKAKGTPGYRLTFRVLQGEHAGRRFWHEIWLTEAAMSMAKRDLAKLGVQSINQLEQPLPLGIRCRAKLVLRTEDDGTEHNRVHTFTVTGIETPDPDPYAPLPLTSPDNKSESDPIEPTGGAA